MDRDALRKLVLGQEVTSAADDRLKRAASRLEQDMVGAVLRVLKFDRTWAPRLRAWAQERYGLPHLYAEAFNALVPDFPYWLGVDDLGGLKLHLDKKATPPRLWSNFAESPFADAFRRQEQIKRLQAEGDRRGLAFVVPRNGVPGGLVVRVPDQLAEPGFTWVWVPPEDDDHRADLPILVIQPFTSYLNHLRQSGWRPPQPERDDVQQQ